MYKLVLYNENKRVITVIKDFKCFTVKENEDGSNDYKFISKNGDTVNVGGCFLNIGIFDETVDIQENDVITEILDKKIETSPFIFVDDPRQIIETQQEYIVALEEKSLLLQNELNKLRGLA